MVNLGAMTRLDSSFTCAVALAAKWRSSNLNDSTVPWTNCLTAPRPEATKTTNLIFHVRERAAMVVLIKGADKQGILQISLKIDELTKTARDFFVSKTVLSSR
jgi:hypothetical protein